MRIMGKVMKNSCCVASGPSMIRRGTGWLGRISPTFPLPYPFFRLFANRSRVHHGIAIPVGGEEISEEGIGTMGDPGGFRGIGLVLGIGGDTQDIFFNVIAQGYGGGSLSVAVHVVFEVVPHLAGGLVAPI
jgi:hypothetical protein